MFILWLSLSLVIFHIIFGKNQLIRPLSSAVDHESYSKFEYITNQRVTRRSLFFLASLGLNPRFVWLIPLMPEPCWKSDRVVGFFFRRCPPEFGRQKQFFHFPRTTSTYTRTPPEVRQSCWFLWLPFFTDTC